MEYRKINVVLLDLVFGIFGARGYQWIESNYIVVFISFFLFVVTKSKPSRIHILKIQFQIDFYSGDGSHVLMYILFPSLSIVRFKSRTAFFILSLATFDVV